MQSVITSTPILWPLLGILAPGRRTPDCHCEGRSNLYVYKSIGKIVFRTTEARGVRCSLRAHNVMRR